eukprot:NODE_121_length_17861_cov_0.498480.p5 type:complete len:285 gc:universal NODE_121_length_17861_cov_0.498480:4671-5525(+)
MSAFGDFKPLCLKTVLPFCKVFNSDTVIPWKDSAQTCQASRVTSIDSDLGEIIACFLAFLGTLIIAYRTYTKYAAVGRIEMNILNIFYGGILLTNVLLGVPSLSDHLPQVAAAYCAFICGFFWVLFMNGFVGYQVVEDGSVLSVWGILLSSLLFSFIGGYYSYGVGWGGISLLPIPKSNSPTLYGILLIWPLISMVLYCGLMVILVFKNLSQRKPIVYLFVSAILMIFSCVFSFALTDQICSGSNKSLSGLPFGVIFGFLAYCMLFKFWFSITEGIFNLFRPIW